MEIGFQQPAIFQTIAAISPALNVDEARPIYDPMLMIADIKTFPACIFLGVGDVASARLKTYELASIIDYLGISYHYSEV